MKLPAILSSKTMEILTVGAVALFVAMGIFVADEKLNPVKDSLRVVRNMKGSSRELSVDLGDGACQWTEPMREVPEDLDLWKTLLVGFPSGDKRMAWVQMEALSGLPSKVSVIIYAAMFSLILCSAFLTEWIFAG